MVVGGLSSGIVYPIHHGDASMCDFGRLNRALFALAIVMATAVPARGQSISNGNGTRAGSGKAITYQDVLKLVQLGLGENDVLKVLDKSPTVFTLDTAQIQELKQAGASEKILSAMQRDRSQPGAEGPKVTDFAIVLDCSGSMAELTRDGQVKMEVARRVVTEQASAQLRGERDRL